MVIRSKRVHLCFETCSIVEVSTASHEVDNYKWRYYVCLDVSVVAAGDDFDDDSLRNYFPASIPGVLFCKVLFSILHVSVQFSSLSTDE